MKERIVVANKAFLNKTDFVCIEDIVKDLKVEYIKEQVPEDWEELKKLCKEFEEKTKGKKRVVYCTLLGEIFVCFDDSFGKVGFCLSLKNIENPKRDIVHIKIINFKLNILYNSFDMPLSNSINFIKSLIGEE